jgi:hypothetical protein
MFYFDFGGVAKILESATLLNKNILTQGARFVAPIETFFHSLRWETMSRFSFLHLVKNEMRNFLIDSPFPVPNGIIAGGFVRALIVSTCRKWKLEINANITSTFHDIDIFVSDNYNFSEILQPPNDFSNNHKVQIVDAQTLFYYVSKKTESDIVKIIKTFDFTPTQVALFGEDWFNNPKISCTPAFIYSLMKGKMYLSYFNSIPWPFHGLESQVLYPNLKEYGDRDHYLFERYKVSCVNRFFKYVSRGYKDAILTTEQIEKLENLIKMYNAPQSLDEENLCYDIMFEFLQNVF